jgi:alcohol dehydrogenase (NADP+)
MSTIYQAKAYSAASKTSPLASASIPRRDTTARDVQIEILFCGICHSDLHQARDEWNTVMPTVYPCVPGHEIVGRVTKLGAEVTKFKVGDLLGRMPRRFRSHVSGLQSWRRGNPNPANQRGL